MTDTVTENGEVSRYLAAIREALADLPAEDRDDLLEDLAAHLYEVVAESGTTLEASLGSPAAYAAELRVTAGLEPAPRGAVPALRRMEQAVSTSSFWAGVATAYDQPPARAVREFVPTLRPAWWVVRGWLWLFAVVVWLHNGELEPYRQRLVVPTYHDHWSVGVLALAVAVVASVWLGLRQPGLSVQLRRAIGLVSMVVVLFALSDYGNAENIASNGFYALTPVAAPTAQATPYPGLTLDGRHPLNIYPYDAQGHLLTGVRLYDDRGQPLQGLGKSNSLGQDLVRVLPSDAAGAIVANEYPQAVGGISGQQLGLDANGNANRPPTAGPAAVSAYALSTPMPTPTVFVPPMAGATQSPSPSLSPSPSPSPSPATLTPAVTRSAKASAKAARASKRPARG